MRIAVVHNQPAKSSSFPAAERGVLDQVRTIAGAFSAAGHETATCAVDGAPALCGFLSRPRPQLIFNCCESIDGRAALEMNVAAAFELFEVPFTGSSALTLGLALDKAITKAVLAAHAIPTAPHVVFDLDADPPPTHRLAFPLIVKPVAEDASIGIDDGAVVNDQDALGERVRFVWRTFRQAALVEEFIAGREFNVSLLATSTNGDFLALPIGEILFDGLPAGRPRIVGYEAKWVPDSPGYRGTVASCPAVLALEMAERVRRTALAAARAVGLRDYGRVDLRLRERDQALFVLEVNPNPDLSPDAGFLRAACASGRTIQGTILEIAERALERTGRTRAGSRIWSATQ